METNIKFQFERAELKLEIEFLVFFEFFLKRRLKNEKQEKINIVNEGIEESCESESKETWPG